MLSILQFWPEKHLGELAQFKARLQFRRAHQPANQPSISFTQGVRLQLHELRSQAKVTNLAIGFLYR
jgi:hypothetical protein